MASELRRKEGFPVKKVVRKRFSLNNAKKRVSKANMNRVKEHATQHLWSVKDKKALLEGIKQHGFERLDEVAKIIGTKDVNEIRHFLENRRLSLMRKIKEDDSYKTEGRKRALIELWSQTLNREVHSRYRSNDCSSCVAEVFKYAAEKEPHLSPQDEMEPDIAAIYHFFGKVISGVFPSELRAIDSMLVLYLIQNLRDILTTNGLEEERELYSKFQGGKGNANLLTEEIPNSSGDQENDPFMPYKETKPEIIKLSKEYRRLLQFFNPLHVPPSLLQEETELLKKHTYENL